MSHLQKLINCATGQIVAVEMSIGANNIKLTKNLKKTENFYFSVDYDILSKIICSKKLYFSLFGGRKKYPKNLIIVADTESLTCDSVEQFVAKKEGTQDQYLDYMNLDTDSSFDNSIESFLSLLHSYGLDHTKRYIILRVVN